ncbi:MAG: xanthine dehydrogenase family protein molybdopterin-binding subunit, partial [Burkholderiales bacterium]|nr:xanthine dehydrogenase family protein molybdopterin-binding subunit [Burkholderiales bacterium]
PPKTNGTAKFGIDAKLPGLLTAVVARAPVPGAKPVKYDAAKIRAMPGVKAVLPVQSPTAEGIAVLATNYWYAKQARDALDIEWDLGAGATLSTDTMRTEMTEAARKGEGLVAQQTGDVGAVSGKSVKALYDVPYLVHAPMEPMNCTAWVKPDGVEIWSGSQAQGPNQMTAAALTGFTPEQVKIHSLLLGGGFGRRFAPDMLTEAVLLSKSAGAPVKVVYSREDDTRGYYYRPMAVCEMTGTLDGKGRPLGFKASTVCDSLATGSGFEAMIMKDRIDGTAVEGLVEPPYAIPNVRVDWTLYQPGVRTWFWRSVGSTQNAFFLESFVDELAHAAGQDPVAYRRSLMAGHPRHLAVLELAAQKSGWGQPLPKGVARGVAVAESFGSYVAEVAEVTLVDGKPKVLRVVIAADIGTVVNPDTVVAQMEGAMIYGLSAALQGEITFDAGKVQQSNFHDYPVVRMNEAPKVEVHLIRSTEAPGGVGEPGTPPIAPAVANALFALTGERVRSLPLSRHNFKTA